MREDILINDELVRALSEYLRTEEINTNKYKKLKEINVKSYIKDNLILNKEVNNIYKIQNYKINKYDDANIIINDNGISPREENKIYPLFSSRELEETRTSFLENKTSTLDMNSPIEFRNDEEIILASIKRNIKSIAYVNNITEEIQKQAIVEAKKQGYIFNSNTPLFMLQNMDLIKQSIKLDCNSSIYVIWKNLTTEEINEIEKYIAKNHLDYIICYNSPINFKRNIDICISSAKLDIKSIDYFDWEYLEKNKEVINRIYDILLEHNYVLNYKSPDILKNNTKLCLNSIKNDINSARYFSEDIQYWLTDDLDGFPVDSPEDKNIKSRLYEIRRFLISKDYYSLEQLFNFSVSLLKDDYILDYYLKKLGISKDTENSSTKIFYDRLKDFIKKTLSTSLKVSNTRKVFQMVSQKKWEDYRRENNDYYTNIFNRICDSLEKNNNFISALNELKFLMKIDDVLDERKYTLFNAFIEYHQIYHSTTLENKNNLLQEKRDDISKNAALFISKSKEDFISEQMSLFDEQYKKYFVIRIDNPIVKKKVVEIKQRDMLKKLFNSKNIELLKKLEILKNKYITYDYSSSINKNKIPQIIDLVISQLINNNVSSLDDILLSSKPVRFDEYENYEKVSKIINRLNNHNIAFDSQEVNKYRDSINYDGEKYIYANEGFNENELAQILGYKDLKYVFGKIRSDIIQIAKSIDSFDNLTQEDIKSVIGECPFTDEYYTFDPNIFNSYYSKFFKTFVETFDENKQILLNEENYNVVNKLVIDSGVLILSIISELGSHGKNNEQFTEIKKYISDKEISNVIENTPNLVNIFSKEEFDISNLDKILDFKDMFKYADLKQISLLGKEVIKKIYSNNGFTLSSQSERIRVACDLLSSMVIRNKSTVPYISGSYGNYKYSMYDSLDETLLTSGLDTNACFRCCGNDNDFLHYCALDKNGFVIKLTDSEGNFIGRASGFRNGNGVYINQLRTIYDKKSSAYSSELEAIIKTFEQACSDIVEISQNNSDEKTKIDFVVVTKSYTLDNTRSNIDENTTIKIGRSPMDVESKDWKQFKNTTKNLIETSMYDFFYTDFGNYSLICMKSAIGELTPEKIQKGDVPALYNRVRNQISVNENTEAIEKYINKIRACYSHQTGKDFKYVKVPEGSKIITGDNWYIIFGNHGIEDNCCLFSDEMAKVEFSSAIKHITLNQIKSEENIREFSSKK